MNDPILRYIRSNRRWVPEADVLFKYTFGNIHENLCIFCNKPHESIPLIQSTRETYTGLETGAYLCSSCNKQVHTELDNKVSYSADEIIEHYRQSQYQKLLDVLDNDKPIIADDIQKHLQHLDPSKIDIFAGLHNHCYLCGQEELGAYKMYNHGGELLSDSLPIPVRPNSLMSGRVGICSRQQCSSLSIDYYHELDNKINISIFEKTCPQCISKYYITLAEQEFRDYYNKVSDKIDFVCPSCAYNNLTSLEKDVPNIVPTELGIPRDQMPSRFHECSCTVCEQYESLDFMFSLFTIHLLQVHRENFICRDCSGLRDWLNNGYVFKLFNNMYLELYKTGPNYSFSVFEIQYGQIKNVLTNIELESEEGVNAISEAFHISFKKLYDNI